MGLREDVKYVLGQDYEPKVPDKQTILKQAKEQLRKGKSTGSISLDLQATRIFGDEEER